MLTVLATCRPQGAWLSRMVQMSRQLARLHYTDLEHAVSIEQLQVDSKIAIGIVRCIEVDRHSWVLGMMHERPMHVLRCRLRLRHSGRSTWLLAT
jgi:hypothetical protein